MRMDFEMENAFPLLSQSSLIANRIDEWTRSMRTCSFLALHDKVPCFVDGMNASTELLRANEVARINL